MKDQMEDWTSKMSTYTSVFGVDYYWLRVHLGLLTSMSSQGLSWISFFFFFFLPSNWLKVLLITFMYRNLHGVHLAQLGGQFFGLRLLQLGDASH